jgi:hypothetical protein
VVRVLLAGPQSYYWIIEEPGDSFIRAIYKPPLQTVTLFANVGDALRKGVDKIRFRWRAWVMPVAGNECVPGRGDSVANVYIAWKRGLRWYSVKLVWSTDDAEVPGLQGIGIMTDGDQTNSTSAADYAGFVLYTHERTAAR